MNENVPISVSRGIIKPGSTHSNEFDAELDVGTIEKVKFLWNNHVINPTFPKVGASKITVQKGEEKAVYVSGGPVPGAFAAIPVCKANSPQRVRLWAC